MAHLRRRVQMPVASVRARAGALDRHSGQANSHPPRQACSISLACQHPRQWRIHVQPRKHFFEFTPRITPYFLLPFYFLFLSLSFYFPFSSPSSFLLQQRKVWRGGAVSSPAGPESGRISMHCIKASRNSVQSAQQSSTSSKPDQYHQLIMTFIWHRPFTCIVSVSLPVRFFLYYCTFIDQAMYFCSDVAVLNKRILYRNIGELFWIRPH